MLYKDKRSSWFTVMGDLWLTTAQQSAPNASTWQRAHTMRKNAKKSKPNRWNSLYNTPSAGGLS